MWLVAICKLNREMWAAENVVRQGYSFYFPRVLESVRVSGRGKLGKMQAKPLFPGYLFVCTDGAWHFLSGTFGVRRLVLFGDGPAIISDKDIEKLKAREVNGYVELPHKGQGRLSVGDAVRVRGGAFSGCVGIYQGVNARDRNNMLLDFLGQKSKVLIAEELLEVI